MIAKLLPQGDDIILRNINESDASIMTQWINNQDISRCLQVSSPVTENEEIIWIKRMRKSCDDQVFAIIEKNTEEYIGNIGLHDISRTNKAATIGLFVGDISKQGKGYGTQAVKLVVDFGLKQLGLTEFRAPIFLSNKKSMATFKKNGFMISDAPPIEFLKNGKFEKILSFVYSKGN